MQAYKLFNEQPIHFYSLRKGHRIVWALSHLYLGETILYNIYMIISTYQIIIHI